MTEPTHPLYQLRTKRGLSRERLAQKAEISARTVFAIEREGHRPHRSTAAVLADALGCDPEELTASAK